MYRTNSPAHLADQPPSRQRLPGLAIESAGLVKRFGEVVAVDGVDLHVPHGCIFALLGPNGAGKTTVIRVLACLLRPDAGTARILGHDVSREPDAVRGSISLTGQFASVDEDLTGRENLVLLARLLGHRPAAARRRSDDLLAAFGLTEAANRQVKKYSGGMRRRLDIAASIVATPKLLFLDEPTTGLDPRSRAQVWDIVRELVAAGTTVLLTTQYLDEADALADHIAVIDRGRIIAEGTSADLKSSVGAGSVRVRVRVPEQREEAAHVLGGALASEIVRESDPGLLSARTDDAEQVVEALYRVVRSGVAVADFSLAQPSLDEVFMAITGHAATASPDLEADEPPEGSTTGKDERS